MRNPQHEYTAEQLRITLVQLRDVDDIDTPILAKMFGVSESLIYQWCSQESTKLPNGAQLIYGARRLSDRLGNDRLASMAHGTSKTLVEAEDRKANGTLADERDDLIDILHDAVELEGSPNADELHGLFERLEDVAYRFLAEEGKIRQSNNS